MLGMGFKRVHALLGGWREWEKRRLPTEPK